MSASKFFLCFRLASMLLILCIAWSTISAPAHAQTTIASGGIVGAVTDPSGAAVAGATVTISNKNTGQAVDLVTNSSGAYSAGTVTPGEYTVRITATGFRPVVLSLTVQVGVLATGNAKLALGAVSDVVTVQASAVTVDMGQSTVEGVLTAEQIDTLPINGRNFLDLAQLEPGVQIQDGTNFDPTKNGYSSISFGGRFGRNARIEVDGLDISDETVGTTTQNIPPGAIEEFQIAQSTLDLSTELTSSGSVNVVTRSGTNKYHGEGFYLFRDHRFAAPQPGGQDTPFQRNQFGGRLGGAVIKDKLFFFLDAERIKQDVFSLVLPAGAFSSLQGGYSSPFRETETLGRIDWQVKPNNFHVFYRFTFEQNSSLAGVLPTFQPFKNADRTPSHVGGLDFTSGHFTHSIRAEYLKFHNNISNGVAGTGIYNPAPQLELSIGSDPTCQIPGMDVFCSGPSYLSPQATLQTNKQIKYDGSDVLGNHILRYGFAYNRINGGGFASFLASGPEVNAPTDSGTSSNPLAYLATNVVLGNGQGFVSEFPAFGFAGGGLGPDNRISSYVGDSWKIKPNLTVIYGLHYDRDTWRTDSDIAPIPCSELNTTLATNLATAGTPCTGNILDLFGQGLGNRVKQPNLNFAPQVGFSWDPWKNGKTSIRGGASIEYENNIWNNLFFDRPVRLPKGLFLNFQQACVGGTPVTYTLPGTSTSVTPTFCGQPIGSVEDQVVQLQQQYQTATATAGAASNAGFIGNSLTATIGGTGTALFDPDFKSARAVQMNIGVQREIRKGLVLNVDYLRNVGTHNLVGVDVNHVGDAGYFNLANAQLAVQTTLNNCGVSTVQQAIILCPLNPVPQNTAPYTPRPATISDFAQNGLDSGNFLCGGAPCPNAAFPGKNLNLGANQMLMPGGRSVYNGLQMKLHEVVSNPFPEVKKLNLQFAYSLSRYVAMTRDADIANSATDNDNPTRYIGPNALDRTHQISFGGTAELPYNFQLSIVSHFYSPLPSSLYLPVTGSAGGIFVSDVTGDGSGDGSVLYPTGDLLPGTNVGAYDRTVNAGSLNKLIGIYNTNDAGQPTPAGKVLIQNGLFNLGQLQALGGVQPTLQSAPAGQANLGWLHAFDLKMGWTLKVKERLSLEPNVAFYNLFNFANFDAAGNLMSGTLDGTVGSLNGTTTGLAQRAANRIGLGTGTFALGSPRAIEFGLRLSF